MNRPPSSSPGRFDHSEHEHLHPPFGPDRFGQVAERVARFFGTPRYILAQSGIVIIWIIINAAAISLRWDPYPFILLNLVFSTQAAYAAPLILLAQTRQADRDKATESASAKHRDAIATSQQELLEQNTRLTEEATRLAKQIEELTLAIHRQVVERAI